jgi:hypothetical protein
MTNYTCGECNQKRQEEFGVNYEPIVLVQVKGCQAHINETGHMHYFSLGEWMSREDACLVKIA